MKTALAIYRAGCFSPNSEAKDKAIMDAVADIVEGRGCVVVRKNEEQLTAADTADVVLTMGRLPRTISLLAALEAQGSRVLNASRGLMSCSRSHIETLMRRHGIPCAPLTGHDGYWVKRGDEAAQSAADVAFAADEAEMHSLVASMQARGVADVVVTAHVNGDLVKFYGVRGTGFFETFHPGDDGDFKFGSEVINGSPRHYSFSKSSLSTDADRLAALVGVDVYGGDCIIRPDGTYAIIDFNDWPSFSRCRKEAAEAIAFLAGKKV